MNYDIDYLRYQKTLAEDERDTLREELRVLRLKIQQMKSTVECWRKILRHDAAMFYRVMDYFLEAQK